MKALRPTAALALACLLAGCKKAPPPPHRTEPWLAHPSASASGSAAGPSAPQSFHFLSESYVRFSVPGRKATVSGRAPVKSGRLRVDFGELKSASASLDVDLTQLTVDVDQVPSEVDPGGTAPSTLAREWLELGPGVAPEKRAQYGLAHFELTSVESSSAHVLALDGDDKRHDKVRVSVVGTLLIHGFRAPVHAELLLAPAEHPSGTPARLSIRSARALVLPLAPHDIAARGPSGVADELQNARASGWIGSRVQLEVQLLAELEP